jgi:hypothetical protein
MYEYHDKGYFSNKTIQYYIHNRLDIIKAMEDVLDHCYNEWKNDSLSYTNIFVKARDYRKHEDYEVFLYTQKERKDFEELMQNSLLLPWEEDLFPEDKPHISLSAINQDYFEEFPIFFKRSSGRPPITNLQFRGFSVFLPGFFQFISGEVKKLKATTDNDYIKIYLPIPQEIELKLETKTGEEITHTKVIYSAEMGFLKILKNDFKPVYA